MKRAFLFLTFAILYCNFTLAQEPDPDPNLIWISDPSWVDGFERFLVHPNGNILAGIGSTEFELDGNTGLIIREFPFPAVFYDVSPDGKYISALTDQRCVIDYETEEIIDRFTSLNTKPKFMPDSKTLVYFLIEPLGELNGNLKLQSYNFETKQYKSSAEFIQNTTTGTIAVSPDGRYVATSGRNFDYDEDGYTELILWDAETLAPIKYLKQFQQYYPVNSIKFSPDSRLVGFGVYRSNLHVYNTFNYELVKHFNGFPNYESAVDAFSLTHDNLLSYAYENNFSNNEYFIKILDLDKNIVLYENRQLAAAEIKFNDALKTMLVAYGHLYCYDFEKILTGASIEPEIPNPFSVDYVNNSLSIRNYTFVTNAIDCTISDISGRVLRNLNVTPSTNEIRIPIKLQSGTYFLHIKDGGKEYVAKFLVTN